MKKIILSLIVLIGLFVVGCGFSLKAAEIGKEYTASDEGGTYTLILTDETNLYFKAVNSEAGMTIEFNGVYKHDEENENVISVYLVKETAEGETIHDYINDFVLNEDGTMEILDEELPEEQPIVYPCYVAVKETNYGELKIDVESGEIGTIVTVTPKAYTFCKLDNITVNGVELIPNENGLYQFALVEGENVLQGNFSINKEDMELIAGLINDAKKGNWEDIFTIERLFDIISWVITALFSTGFLVTLVKLKNVKAQTSNDVVATTGDTINTAIDKYLDEKFAPLLLRIENRSISTEEIAKVLARCMTLAQENTSEARLAIVAELTKLQTSSVDLAKQVQGIIADEVAKSKEVHEKKLQAIEELKKANEEITSNKKQENNSEGRI